MAISFTNTDAKVLNKINQMKKFIKISSRIHHDQVGFSLEMQDRFTLGKQINVFTTLAD